MSSDAIVDNDRGKGPDRRLNTAHILRDHGGLIALILLLVFNAFVTPNFLQLQTLFVNISQVATIAIVAIGMTLVIATAGIDLSVGAVMALAGALSPLIFNSPFGIEYPVLGLIAAFTPQPEALDRMAPRGRS
mgnify:CR=1 FL=1